MLVCRDQILSFRVTAEERIRIEAVVEERGTMLSRVVRTAVMREVKSAEARRAKEVDDE